MEQRPAVAAVLHLLLDIAKGITINGCDKSV